MLRNTEHAYGWVAIVLHWLVAIAIVGLFALGLWMVELSYYDPWYRRAPDIHKGIGVMLFAVMIGRVVWRLINPRPRPEPGAGRIERGLASAAHRVLYVLIFAVMVSGYLISTADGRPIDVFGLFSIPATFTAIENQEDIAGTIHLGLAISLVALAGLHALAALKHHFWNRDRTLARMLGGNG